MRVAGSPTMWTVNTRGNDLPYTHPEVWLTSECVIDTGYSIIPFTKVREIDTAMAFKGVVRPRTLTHLVSAPVITPHEPVVTELMQFIRTEAAGVSVTPRLVHTLQLRARSWCTANDHPIPVDIDEQVFQAIKMGMETTKSTWGRMDTEEVEAVNDIINQFTPNEQLTTWQRAGRLLWWVTGPVRKPTVCVLSYVWFITAVQMAMIYETSRVKIVGGLAKLRLQYALAKQKKSKWYLGSWFSVPTCIPANVPDNELTSIFRRAFPPTRTTKLPQVIPEAADLLARKLGKLEAPMDMDEWLSRFTPVRREQIRAAGLNKPNDLVEFFQKIEQLDDCKHPRAIQARVDEFKAAAGPWIAAFEMKCRESLPIFIKGLTPQQKAEKIDRLYQRALTAFELDFSRFDRSLTVDLLEATEHRIYKHCLPEPIARLMTMQLNSRVRTRNNAAYVVNGTRMSGDVNTSIGNCLVVACLMLALKLPLDSFLVEGDDMLAVVTEKEKARIDASILEAAGLSPKIRFIETQQAEFCSRRLIPTILGPRLCRDPRREVARVGYSIHSESDRDKLLRGVHEWQGIPMMGPVYEQALGNTPTPITSEARIAFESVWGISQDEQQKFENDPLFRAEYSWEIAQPDAPATRDRYSAVQRTVENSNKGDITFPVCPGKQRTATPGCPREDVRNVSAPGPGEGAVPRGSGRDRERGGSDRSGLRRKGRSPELRGHSSPLPKEHDASVARQHPERSPQQSNEAKVAGDGHGHTKQHKLEWRPKLS